MSSKTEGPTALALEFVRAFGAADLEGMARLLAEDLRFRGPVLSANSRAKYLEALERDPLEPAECEILEVVEDGPRVAVLYCYSPSTGPVLVAQWNLCREREIAEIHLVFHRA